MRTRSLSENETTLFFFWVHFIVVLDVLALKIQAFFFSPIKIITSTETIIFFDFTLISENIIWYTTSIQCLWRQSPWSLTIKFSHFLFLELTAEILLNDQWSFTEKIIFDIVYWLFIKIMEKDFTICEILQISQQRVIWLSFGSVMIVLRGFMWPVLTIYVEKEQVSIKSDDNFGLIRENLSRSIHEFQRYS